MARPWKTLAQVPTPEGKLELRQRGDDEFLILIAGRVLMTSQARRSEESLSTLALAQVKATRPRVLIGGLGMAYTVRAALDVLPAGASVVVAELHREVAEWCRGPLAPLTAGSVLDPRVKVEIGDVSKVIARAKAGSLDAIILDLFEGPHAATQTRDDPFYGMAALARSRAALAPGGVLAIWSEDPDVPFERRFGGAGFEVKKHRAGKGGSTHVIYLGRRT
jgi:spermidine synthase